jgi:hypothetical protein
MWYWNANLVGHTDMITLAIVALLLGLAPDGRRGKIASSFGVMPRPVRRAAAGAR